MISKEIILFSAITLFLSIIIYNVYFPNVEMKKSYGGFELRVFFKGNSSDYQGIENVFKQTGGKFKTFRRKSIDERTDVYINIHNPNFGLKLRDEPMHLELKARKNIHELSGMEGWMKVYHGNESFKNVQLTKEILCSRLAEYGDTCTDIKNTDIPTNIFTVHKKISKNKVNTNGFTDNFKEEIRNKIEQIAGVSDDQKEISGGFSFEYSILSVSHNNNCDEQYHTIDIENVSNPIVARAVLDLLLSKAQVPSGDIIYGGYPTFLLYLANRNNNTNTNTPNE